VFENNGCNFGFLITVIVPNWSFHSDKESHEKCQRRL